MSAVLGGGFASRHWSDVVQTHFSDLIELGIGIQQIEFTIRSRRQLTNCHADVP